ncbi:hypothetical protein [Armatimonas rosea]|uniref:Uncharacterized protein n=1 Tax=Armatimonas rosea TaxID=685828 RepID=A0A7W9SR95_ARMRO|nr:hypothetical protein [Armatimonas rosea]MBB6051337.1 hypothetical protein [Armatimonas rosea]
MELNQRFKVGKSSVQLIIKTGHIDVRKHKFSHVDGEVVMDGLATMGIDNTPNEVKDLRRFEEYVTVFQVKWDGKTVPIRKEDYGNIFNPSFKMAVDSESRLASGESVLIMPSVKGDAFLLSIRGGQGGGHFTAWWMIRKEGVVGLCKEGPP